MIWTLKIEIWKGWNWLQEWTKWCYDSKWKTEFMKSERGWKQEKKASKEVFASWSENWKTLSSSMIFIPYFVQTQCSWCVMRVATEFWCWISLQLKEILEMDCSLASVREMCKNLPGLTKKWGNGRLLNEVSKVREQTPKGDTGEEAPQRSLTGMVASEQMQICRWHRLVVHVLVRGRLSLHSMLPEKCGTLCYWCRSVLQCQECMQALRRMYNSWSISNLAWDRGAAVQKKRRPDVCEQWSSKSASTSAVPVPGISSTGEILREWEGIKKKKDTVCSCPTVGGTETS